MSAGRICSKWVVIATPDESVRVAAQRLDEYELGTLVVVKARGDPEPVGILTDRDIVVRCVAAGLDPDTTALAQVMTHPVRAIDQHTPIEQAIKRMAEASTRRLVVTGEHGELVGILSLDDVLDLLVEELGPIHELLQRQHPLVPA
jgi:CBS domain-containing protein